MNILVFSWRGPKHPNAGGAEYSTHEHSKGWVNAGHKVTLFTSEFVNSISEENIDGVNIIRRGNQIFGVHIKALFWYLFENRVNFDVVVDEIHGIPFFTPLYAKIPKIAFIHEVAKEVWKLNSWKKPFNLLPAVIGTAFEPLIFKLFYQKIPFMTVSNSTKNDLINWGISSNNIKIVHNGFQKITPFLLKKEKVTTIIYLGALSKDKGIEDALDTFYHLKLFDEKMKFWIVGKGENKYLEYLIKKTKQLGIYKKITFFGFVSDERKNKLLSKAHILINPSIREGWGLVVIEAASVGTPTVGYDVAGLRDSIIDGKTGLLCDPHYIDCTNKIIQLLNDKKLYLEMTKNCINWSNKFSWGEASSNSLNYLINIVNKKTI